MGYYSELAIDDSYHEDRSYPSPELQLKWRIEDLRSRLEEISTGNYGITAHSFMGCQFSRDDLAYIPPEYISNERDIIAAIAIAEEKLAFVETDIVEIYDDVTTTTEELIPFPDPLPGQLAVWDSLQAELNDVNAKPELDPAA